MKTRINNERQMNKLKVKKKMIANCKRKLEIEGVFSLSDIPLKLRVSLNFDIAKHITK